MARRAPVVGSTASSRWTVPWRSCARSRPPKAPRARRPSSPLTTGLNRATAWRILRTLELQGLVSYDPRTRRFSIGMGVVDLAQAAVPNTLLSRARTVVRNLSLQTRETVALALMEETELRYVVEVQPSTSDEPSWLGEGAGPLHATSSGKIVLAWLGTEAAGPEPYLRYTDSTIVTHRAARGGARRRPRARLRPVPGRVRRVHLGSLGPAPRPRPAADRRAQPVGSRHPGRARAVRRARLCWPGMRPGVSSRRDRRPDLPGGRCGPAAGGGAPRAAQHDGRCPRRSCSSPSAC